MLFARRVYNFITIIIVRRAFFVARARDGICARIRRTRVFIFYIPRRSNKRWRRRRRRIGYTFIILYIIIIVILYTDAAPPLCGRIIYIYIYGPDRRRV